MKRKLCIGCCVIIKKYDAVAQRGRLAQLLALPMVLNDVVERGGMVSYQQYNALYKKYTKIAEGVLNA